MNSFDHINRCSSIYLQSDEVYLEAQIQNITPGPVYMERVALEPSPQYTSTELNAQTEKERWVNLLLNWFSLSPKDSITSKLETVLVFNQPESNITSLSVVREIQFYQNMQLRIKHSFFLI